ncbi:hypothetical protein ENBRE01_2144, partial [Enteropsectra breve]
MVVHLQSSNYSLLHEPNTDASIILTDNEAAISYALTIGWLGNGASCKKCGELATLTSYSRYTNNFAYRCTNRSCRSFMNILEGLYIASPKIKLCSYFKAIYKWEENSTEANVLRNTGLSKASYSSIKSEISAFLHDYNSLNSTLKLGNDSLGVQVDETAICHGSLPNCPSQLDDDFPGITWLVGIIEQSTGRIKLEIV